MNPRSRYTAVSLRGHCSNGVVGLSFKQCLQFTIVLQFLLLFVVDETPPNAVCPPDQTLTIDINTGGRTVTFNDATATDNSGTVNLISQTHRSGQFFVTGSTMVTYTFADPSNNRDSCSFTIEIVEGRRMLLRKAFSFFFRYKVKHEKIVLI